MVDIVLRCPNKIHQKPIRKLVDNELIEKIPNPKILFVASADSIGQFKIQCSDHDCRKSHKGRGWFEITLNGCGGSTVKPMPPGIIKMVDVPYALAEMS